MLITNDLKRAIKELATSAIKEPEKSALIFICVDVENSCALYYNETEKTIHIIGSNGFLNAVKTTEYQCESTLDSIDNLFQSIYDVLYLNRSFK